MGRLSADQREQFTSGFPPDGLEPAQENKLEEGASLEEIAGVERTLHADHIATVRGDFPPPRARFVTVNGPTATGGSRGQEFRILRALLFASDTGEVSEIVSVMFGPNHAHGHMATARAVPLAIADPDGDGTDGVLYRADEQVRWIDFDDGEPVHP
jgi:hypothetical protein